MCAPARLPLSPLQAPLLSVSPLACILLGLSLFIFGGCFLSVTLWPYFSLPLCAYAFLSFCLCLSQSLSEGLFLILYLSLCLSVSASLHLLLSLSPSALFSRLCVSPPVPPPPSSQPKPRWAPGFLWALPSPFQGGGKLGRHRGGAAAS